MFVAGCAVSLCVGCTETHGRVVDQVGVEAPCDASRIEPPSEDEFIAQICRRAHACCASNGEAQRARCAQKLGELRQRSYFDPERAHGCLERLRAVSYDEQGCPLDWVAPSCQSVFYAQGGSKAPGEACAYDPAECAAGPAGQRAHCGPNNADEVAQKLAHCHVLRRGVEGEPCDMTLSIAGALIDAAAFDDHPAAGVFCDALRGLRCDPETAVCTRADVAPRLAVGARCAPLELGLAENNCEPGAHCNWSDFTCEPQRAQGAECQAASDCRSGHCDNARCAPAFGGIKLDLICGNECPTPGFPDAESRAAWTCRL